jgi:hypothetical protein
VGEAGSTRPLPEMVKEYHPDLIVVINGDDMADYKSPAIPKTWVWNQVSTLTAGIKDSGARCVWVGPAWGSERGTFGKTFDRVNKMSDYLAQIVSPCVYIDSHFMPAGYQAWGDAIANEIVSSAILKKIRAKP